MSNSYGFTQLQITKAKKDASGIKFETKTTPPVKKDVVFESGAFRDKFCDIVAPDIRVNAEAAAQLSLGEDKAGMAAEKKKEKASKGLFGKVRGLVSKKKIRFNADGFDLDLTVVTPRIIAMGFPSEGLEAKYRNPHSEVERFFDKYHPDSYKVYNLCSEKAYGEMKFKRGKIARYPFDDHTPPPFDLFLELCKDVDEWFKDNSKNVVAIHCKAGKGRTGTVIAAFLVYKKFVDTANDALLYFAQKRTRNAKGVTIPSQIRYVQYFDKWIHECWANGVEPGRLEPRAVLLEAIKITTIPKVENGGITPYLEIYKPSFAEKGGEFLKFEKDFTIEDKDENGKKKGYYDNEKEIVINCQKVLQGDIKFMLKDHGQNGKEKKKVCHFCVNPYFFPEDQSFVELGKMEIDKARKDKNCRVFGRKFKITLEYSRFTPTQPPEITGTKHNHRREKSFAADPEVLAKRASSMGSDAEKEEVESDDELAENEDDTSEEDGQDLGSTDDEGEEEPEVEKWPLAMKQMMAQEQFGRWPKSEIAEMITVLQALMDSKDQ